MDNWIIPLKNGLFTYYYFNKQTKFCQCFYMVTPKFSRNYRERKMPCLFRLLPISLFQSSWLVYHSHGNNTDVIIQTVSVTSELILGVGPSVYCKKCIIACCSHSNIIQNTFHTPQSFLRSHAHPPSSLTLATNAIFTDDFSLS